jgi:hypothetical protein
MNLHSPFKNSLLIRENRESVFQSNAQPCLPHLLCGSFDRFLQHAQSLRIADVTFAVVISFTRIGARPPSIAWTLCPQKGSPTANRIRTIGISSSIGEVANHEEQRPNKVYILGRILHISPA